MALGGRAHYDNAVRQHTFSGDVSVNALLVSGASGTTASVILDGLAPLDFSVRCSASQARALASALFEAAALLDPIPAASEGLHAWLTPNTGRFQTISDSAG